MFEVRKRRSKASISDWDKVWDGKELDERLTRFCWELNSSGEEVREAGMLVFSMIFMSEISWQENIN